MIKSECCDAPITGTLGDGVLIGWCSKCEEHVSRMHPTNGKLEWLDGESPWTKREDLREMKPQPKLVSRPAHVVSYADEMPAYADLTVSLHHEPKDEVKMTVLKERKPRDGHEYLVFDPRVPLLGADDE